MATRLLVGLALVNLGVLALQLVYMVVTALLGGG
jgi:hypothetical protein